MKKTGTIKSLNVSPKGFYEGLLLQTGKHLVQVNFPKQPPSSLPEAWRVETEVSLEVALEEPHGNPDHQVFRLVRVLGDNGDVVTHPNGHHRFSGRVTQLNYALHGEVNGGILDSGDFLHLKPEGAAALGIKLRMEVEGAGEMKPMVNGRSVIEAVEVNGIALEKHKATKKHHK